MHWISTLHLQSISINCYIQHEPRNIIFELKTCSFFKHQTQIIFFEHKWFINWFIPLEAFVVSNSHNGSYDRNTGSYFSASFVQILQHPALFPLDIFQRFIRSCGVYVNEIKIKNEKQEQNKYTHTKSLSGKVCGKTTKKSSLKIFRIEQPSNCGHNEILAIQLYYFFFNSHIIFIVP